MERLFYMPSDDTPAPPAGIEETWFTTADGLRLHGWFAPAGWREDGGVAAGASAKGESQETGGGSRAPTILLVHGNGGNVSNHFGFAEFLPAAGFNVLVFDYRGYGKSDRGRLRRDELMDDTRAAMEYLVKRRDVDPDRVGVLGYSLGAVFALQLTAERTDVRGAVIIGAFTGWQEIAATTIGGDEPGLLSRSLASMLLPDGLDPIQTIAEHGDRPIMIVHGTEDEIVHYSHALRLLEAGGPGVRLRTVEGGDHNGLRRRDVSLGGDLAQFFGEALGE